MVRPGHHHWGAGPEIGCWVPHPHPVPHPIATHPAGSGPAPSVRQEVTQVFLGRGRGPSSPPGASVSRVLMGYGGL